MLKPSLSNLPENMQTLGCIEAQAGMDEKCRYTMVERGIQRKWLEKKTGSNGRNTGRCHVLCRSQFLAVQTRSNVTAVKPCLKRESGRIDQKRRACGGRKGSPTTLDRDDAKRRHTGYSKGHKLWDDSSENGRKWLEMSPTMAPTVGWMKIVFWEKWTWKKCIFGDSDFFIF